AYAISMEPKRAGRFECTSGLQTGLRKVRSPSLELTGSRSGTTWAQARCGIDGGRPFGAWPDSAPLTAISTPSLRYLNAILPVTSDLSGTTMTILLPPLFHLLFR